MTEYVEAAGRRLEAKTIGEHAPGEPVIVLLHEGLGSVSAWRDFPERLTSATERSVFAYSRIGYGASDPVTLPRPVRYMHDEAYDVLPAVLDAAKIDRAILVGHSDGASIALLHAARFAGPRIVGVVAIAPHVFVEDVGIANIAKAAELFRTTDLRARLERHHGANVDGAFWGWNRVWLDPQFRAWNIEAEIPKIAAPMLLVQGADDEYGTMAQIESIVRHARAPVETTLLAKCGHSPHRDRPDETVEAVAHFVRQRGARIG